MTTGSMKNTEYYKSGKHRENYLAACAKSAEVAKARKLERLQRLQIEYEAAPKVCGVCGNFHSFEKRNNAYCSRSCAITASNRARGEMKPETKAKVSAALKERVSPLKGQKIVSNISFCLTCGTLSRSHRKYCGAYDCIKHTFSGWHNRKGEASYPEKYFMDVFNKEGITGFIREKKVGRWFIDFAFDDKMIALEIDGKQHKYEDRAATDKIKDEFLTSAGWKVIRVDWYNPRTEAGKAKLHPQVKMVLESLRK